MSTLRQKPYGDRRRGHDDEAQGLFPRGSSRPGGLSERKSCIFLSQNFFKIIAARVITSLSLWMIDKKTITFFLGAQAPRSSPSACQPEPRRGTPTPLHPPRNEHKNSVMNKTLRSRNAPRAPLLANGLPLAPATEETRAPVACVGLRAPTPVPPAIAPHGKIKINAQSKKKAEFSRRKSETVLLEYHFWEFPGFTPQMPLV